MKINIFLYLTKKDNQKMPFYYNNTERLSGIWRRSVETGSFYAASSDTTSWVDDIFKIIRSHWMQAARECSDCHCHDLYPTVDVFSLTGRSNRRRPVLYAAVSPPPSLLGWSWYRILDTLDSKCLWTNGWMIKILDLTINKLIINFQL